MRLARYALFVLDCLLRTRDELGGDSMEEVVIYYVSELLRQLAEWEGILGRKFLILAEWSIFWLSELEPQHHHSFEVSHDRMDCRKLACGGNRGLGPPVEVLTS